MAAARSSILLGKVWPSVKKNAAKIKVKKMVLDTNLNMVKFSMCIRLFKN